MDDTTSPPQAAPTAADAAAREFRASLEQRREALDTAALALEARQRSTSQADDLVRHAEALAEQILADARARAERMIADAEAARTALLDVIDRARADLTGPTGSTGPTPAPSAGVDLLFGAVEAARPAAPPSPATPSAPPRRPPWPST